MEKINIIYELLSFCNSNCPHCLRDDSVHYSSSFEDIIKTLDRLKEFMLYRDIDLKLSGGECTIWKDKEYNLSDILYECVIRQIPFSIITNGKIFANKNNISKMFDSFLYKSKQKIKIYFTIDKYHGNYEQGNNTSVILDNIFAYIEENNIANRFDLYVQSTVSSRTEDNISKEFIKKYSMKYFKFIINPLLPLGKGEEFNDFVPTLNINSSDKSSLGDYKKYLYLLGKRNGKWKELKEFENLPNWKLFLQFINCGKTIMIQNKDVYYCMVHAGNQYFRISGIENFSEETFKAFQYNNKICQMWKCNFQKHDNIRKEMKKEEFPFGYGVCCICKELYDTMTGKRI